MERTSEMPAHTVCQACGWREPVEASRPVGIRTWDSTRDQIRYEREKKRREALALQRHAVVAERSLPATRDPRARRARRGNVYEIARSIAR